LEHEIAAQVPHDRFEHVVFVIGAGHSLAAGQPSTASLTSSIADAGATPELTSQLKTSEIELFQRVQTHLRATGIEPTYESIFTWLWTAYFSDDRTMYRGSWEPDAFERIGLERTPELDKLAYSTRGFVEQSVWHALDRPLNLEKAPTLLLDAAADPNVAELTIVTLNHDRLLEELMLNSGLSYCDGFTTRRDGQRVWSSYRPDSRDWNNPVQLIKMHGSIDWWSPSPWNDAGTVYCSTERPDDCKQVPLLLIGTGPKLFQASNLMFARQTLDVGRALAHATRIVILGYSFGDVRMNSLWHGAATAVRAHREATPHTVIVNPASKQTIQSTVALTKRSDRLVELLHNNQAVSYLQANAEEATWSECRTALSAVG
jgi:hypothetical protein